MRVNTKGERAEVLGWQEAAVAATLGGEERGVVVVVEARGVSASVCESVKQGRRVARARAAPPRSPSPSSPLRPRSLTGMEFRRDVATMAWVSSAARSDAKAGTSGSALARVTTRCQRRRSTASLAAAVERRRSSSSRECWAERTCSTISEQTRRSSLGPASPASRRGGSCSAGSNHTVTHAARAGELGHAPRFQCPQPGQA